ncbi:integrase catalytic domain-containing protein [Trichonephila clavipes]|nr:integrase catalytic domain-containing protein [Trichonephila clavipes]
MVALKQKHATLRSAFTRSANSLDALLTAAKAKAADIEVIYEQFERFKNLRNCDIRILDLLQKYKCTQEDSDKEYHACELYEGKFITYKIKVKNILAGKAQGEDVHSFTETGTKFKLPNIELPTFDGNPRDWSSPREIVESFPATAANYKKAIEYLKERYENTSVLIQVYIRDLLQLVMAKNKSDLSSLFDKLKTRIHALDSLGLIKNKYADILVPLVESALQVDVVKLWERQQHLSTDKDQGKTDLDLLMEFMKNEADSEFRVKITREIFNPDKVNNKKNVNQYSESKTVVSTACEFLTANDNSKSIDNSRKFKNLIIVFCDKLHAYDSCNVVSNMNLEFKKDILKRKNACFLCLKRFHRANQCEKVINVIYVKKRHFILCPDLHSNKLDTLSYRENEENKISTLNSHVQLSDVYLQTLVVKLCNGKKEMLVRAIYDTGSM